MLIDIPTPKCGIDIFYLPELVLQMTQEFWSLLLSLAMPVPLAGIWCFGRGLQNKILTILLSASQLNE